MRIFVSAAALALLSAPAFGQTLVYAPEPVMVAVPAAQPFTLQPAAAPVALYAPAPAAPVESDKRVVRYSYSENKVFDLVGHMGYATTLAFGEKIVAASVGDPLAWETTPLGNRHLLTIKPLEAKSTTSLTVVGESGRIYIFRLTAREGYVADDQITYRVNFRYPDREAKRLAALEDQYPKGDPRDPDNRIDPDDLNFDYAYRGGGELRPTRAFDDGEKTYFQWPKNRRSPAIFTVDGEGREAVVNYTVRGDYFVVHGIARQFTFRDGSDVTCIYNTDFPEAEGYDQGSPPLVSDAAIS